MPPDEWAREVEARMTDAERFSLLSSRIGHGLEDGQDPQATPVYPECAGFVPGIPRLGVPPLLLTDAGTNPPNGRPPNGRPCGTATAFPAGLVLGGTFNPQLAHAVGVVLGREARAKGFNVLLGGGINLPRDPRHGRNFDYLSEDPWLSGVLAAGTVLGCQSQGVIATVEHFSLNAHEINKWWLDARIDPGAHRESDLLAFQVAIERAQPGAVMGACNKVNGSACRGNAALLNGVLKGAWGYPGFVISDRRAVRHWSFALHGLDQHLGAHLDDEEWFNEPLKKAYAAGEFPSERLSDMVRRILRSIRAVGADRWGAPPELDAAAHQAVALEVARQGTVLLKNDGVLPLHPHLRSVGLIGGHTGRSVLAEIDAPWSPLAGLRRLLPETAVRFDPGLYPAGAAELARRCDVAVVVATKPESAGFDSPDLTLPLGQDTLIEAVAEANPNTVVVLETGNPIAMPWHDRVSAILQAWYPGQAGGQAIAEILTGEVNPSARLPMTFPADVGQLPRPELAGFGDPVGTPLTVDYYEGAEVGYRWFAKYRLRPRYAFGHGLSYTTFGYADLQVAGGDTVRATFTVTNAGRVAGAVVPQLYLTRAAGSARTRLLGFERVHLGPGESRRITITADPRLLATFDATAGRWRIADGTHEVALAAAADRPVLTAGATLTGREFGS